MVQLQTLTYPKLNCHLFTSLKVSILRFHQCHSKMSLLKSLQNAHLIIRYLKVRSSYTWPCSITSSKSSGADGFSSMMLKHVFTSIIPLIATLFKMGFTSSACLEWNLTNADSTGTVEIVLINGMSLFKRLAVLHFKITHGDDLHITN